MEKGDKLTIDSRRDMWCLSKTGVSEKRVNYYWSGMDRNVRRYMGSLSSVKCVRSIKPLKSISIHLWGSRGTYHCQVDFLKPYLRYSRGDTSSQIYLASKICCFLCDWQRLKMLWARFNTQNAGRNCTKSRICSFGNIVPCWVQQ